MNLDPSDTRHRRSFAYLWKAEWVTAQETSTQLFRVQVQRWSLCTHRKVQNGKANSLALQLSCYLNEFSFLVVRPNNGDSGSGWEDVLLYKQFFFFSSVPYSSMGAEMVKGELQDQSLLQSENCPLWELPIQSMVPIETMRLLFPNTGRCFFLSCLFNNSDSLLISHLVTHALSTVAVYWPTMWRRKCRWTSGQTRVMST